MNYFKLQPIFTVENIYLVMKSIVFFLLFFFFKHHLILDTSKEKGEFKKNLLWQSLFMKFPCCQPFLLTAIHSSLSYANISHFLDHTGSLQWTCTTTVQTLKTNFYTEPIISIVNGCTGTKTGIELEHRKATNRWKCTRIS